jgi:hypothetical protein
VPTALKIFRWTLVAAAGLILVLFSLSFLLRGRVVDIFLHSVNNRISTKLIVGEYRLSLLKRFPRASVELRDVTVLSSPSFDRTQFNGMNTDTLLEARSVFLEFSMSDIINANYTIGSIAVDEGRLNLYSDSSGNVNYEISPGTSAADDESFTINLDKVNVSGLSTTYVNTAVELNIAGLIETGRFKTRISGSDIDFTCSGDINLRKFDLYSASLSTDASVRVDINLNDSDSRLVFRKGALKFEDFRFGITGYISKTDEMDLRITGQDLDLGRIMKYLPEEFRSKFMEYSPEGTVKTECRISGQVSRRETPGIELGFSVSNGRILYGKSSISLKNLDLSGRFSNGRLRKPGSSTLEIEKFSFSLGSASLKGHLKLSGFPLPWVEMTFSGDVIPDEILKFISIPEITRAEGTLRINASLAGRLRKKDKYTISDIIDFNPAANIQFNSFGIEFKDELLPVSDVDGNIMIAANLWADELLFTIRDQRFRVNGEFINLPAWLAGRPARIRAVADISASNFRPLLLFADSAKSRKNPEPFSLPEGIEARINFRADNMEYRKFRAENVSGLLFYMPGKLELKDLKIVALNGSTKGEFYIARNGTKSFITKGNFNAEGIDINQAFSSFNNFGQDFIIADNLAGSLSGNISFLMPLDSMLNPDIKSVTADGRYILEEGELRNFEPLKALSGFIELSELENITFSKLENDLFIRNNYLAVPQMDIKSSAADFTVNGRHSFDNDYEYHIKTYLSEVLSRKAGKKAGTREDFGAVEEDGLGRTSIYLKLTGKGEEIKVTYDLKAAGGNIRQSLRNEKNNLKNILNQEYGLFKGDTAAKQETAPKPRFKIHFSETDSAETVKDTVSVVEVRGINRIFKKKKGIIQI